MRLPAIVAVAVVAVTACTAQPEPDGTPTASPTPTVTSPAPSPSPSPTGEDDTAAIGTLAYVDRTFEQAEEDTPRLVVVDVPDGQGRAIAEGALTGTVWSPAGDRLAYIGRPASPEGPIAEQLVVADVAAGTTTVAATGNFSSPAWSPDGQRLAVSSNEPGERDPIAIAVVDLRTSETTAVTQPPEGTDDLFPAWSPDGQRIAFVRNSHPPPTSQDPAGTQILTAAPDGSDQHTLAPELFEEGPAAWSPDGHTIAFTASPSPDVEGPRHLYLAPADGGEPTRLEVTGARGDVVVSSDGTLVAVAVGTRPDESDIHVIDVTVAGGSTVATFDADAVDLSPTWSPDDTHVAFGAATGLEGQTDIALGEVASGQVRMLTDDGSVESPDFAPR